MRKIKRSLIILMIAILCLSNVACSNVRNVYAESIVLPAIINESFELEDSESEILKPSGWLVEKNGDFEGDFAFVSKNAYDGVKYYQLSDGEYTLRTEDYIEINGWENYVFGAKYISSSLENKCEIFIEAFDNSNKLLSNVFQDKRKNIC